MYLCFLYVWQIENLKSTLQSLPTEMRVKAVDFINKTMNPVAHKDVYVVI